MGRFLILDLRAPLLAFGGEVVDNIGVVVDFPLTSSLTGLIANALGWERTEEARHAELQSRIRFAAAIVDDGQHMVDFQTSELQKNDKGWTRRGVESRGGSGPSYDSPHLRHVPYHMDRRILVALELVGDASPSIEEVAEAIRMPARPLFLGRKTCLPSEYLVRDVIDADTLTDAISRYVVASEAMMLPEDEPAMAGDRIEFFADLRNWTAGPHTGGRFVRYRRNFAEAIQ